MAENVLADAQFGIVKILRPYIGFDAPLDSGGMAPAGSYQGTSSQVPIMLSEGGQPLDEAAGQLGYSPKLLRGLSVPLGSRVVLWVPLVTPQSGGTAPDGYVFSVCWRLRNTFDFRQRRIPYHYPKAAQGVPYNSESRVVIPAAAQSVVYNQSEPVVTLAPAVATSYAEAIKFNFSVNMLPPLLPDGSYGAMEQGIIDVNGPGEAITTTYQVWELQAFGDELLIGLQRAGDKWDFAEGKIDNQLSVVLGNGSGKLYPDVGVYAMVGTAP